MELPSPEVLAEFYESPAAFRGSLIVDTDEEIGPFRPDPWQIEDFAKIDPLWLRAVGASQEPEIPRGWVGRSRGHSKTTDQAMMVLWALIFARRPVKGVVAATAEEQAQILLKRIVDLVMLNPWMSRLLNINKFNITNIDNTSDAFTSNLDVISSDAPSQYGLIADFVLCDELTHWQNEKMWKALSSTAGKRKRCLLLVMTNAGYMKSWQRQIYELALKKWMFINHDGPKASWISEKMLADQLEVLRHRKEYDRLWMNKWQIEAGDCLEEVDVRKAIVKSLKEGRGPKPGWVYVAGMDLATTRDRAALVVLGANRELERIRVVYCQSWRPLANGEVPLDLVDKAAREVCGRFKCEFLSYDPTQAEFMVMGMRDAGIRAEKMSFQSGANCDLMANRMMESFKARRIDIPDDEELIQSLFSLSIVRKRFGYKLEAEFSEFTGHADKAFALAIALPAAVELAGTSPVNCFTPGRHMVQTLDEALQKLHNLDKQEQESILGRIDAALAESPVGDMSRQRVEDQRPEIVRALEENAIQLEPEEAA